MKPADLLLTGGLVITMNASTQVHAPGSLVMTAGQIMDVGPSPKVDARWKPREVLDVQGRIIMPGLINSHTHVAMAFTRGLGHLPNLDALYDVAWPLEQLLAPEDIYPLALLGIAECLKSGSTTIADHYFHASHIAQACLDSGIRAVLGSTLIDQGGPLPSESTWEKTLDFLETWTGRTSRITLAVAPHATDTVSPSLLRQAIKLSRDEELLIHMHLSQSDEEVGVIEKAHGKTPVGYLWEMGGLGPRTLAAHANHLKEGDLHLLATSGCSVAYCPSSHASTGHAAPAAHMIRQGIPVCLGTDCPAFNDDMDMLEEMRTAIFCQNTLERQAWAIPIAKAVEMATSGGASALALDKITGSLEPGKRGDILLLDARAPRMTPLHAGTGASLVALCASEAQVEAVWVDGIQVVKDGRLLTIDEEEVLARGASTCRRLAKRASARAPALYRALLGER
ncbi:MAG: amidohydrolase [Bacillota bacterium]